MGACLSSSNIDTRTAGQGQRLGGASTSSSSGAAKDGKANVVAAQPASGSTMIAKPPRVARSASGNADREQRAKAAEERARALANRGAVAGSGSTAGGGKLSRKLEEQNRRPYGASDEAQPERVIWD